jgi:hypothetical protein
MEPGDVANMTEEQRRDLAQAHRDEIVPGSEIAIEGWKVDRELAELLKNPEFVESLEQMKRGEGRVIHPREFGSD